MSDDSKQQGRFARWSQRKIAVAKGDIVDEEHEDIDATEASREGVELEISPEREAELTANRDAAEAVNLETIDEETDFSIFQKDGVPEALKNKAYATLWRSNPIFANVDGLVDYDDDFGSPDLIMKTFESAYQIGKGYFFEEKSDEDEEVLAEDDIVSDEEEIVSSVEPDANVEEVVAADMGAELIDEDVVETVPEITVESAAIVYAEEEIIKPKPRVSMRRRLEMDT